MRLCVINQCRKALMNQGTNKAASAMSVNAGKIHGEGLRTKENPDFMYSFNFYARAYSPVTISHELSNDNHRLNSSQSIVISLLSILKASATTTMTSVSQQLVRKLLKATAPDEPAALVLKKESSSSSSAKKQKANRKRKHGLDAADEAANNAVTEQDVLRWHTQTLLVADRKMEASGSKNSNASAFKKSLKKLEHTIETDRSQRLKCSTTILLATAGSGAARTATAAAQAHLVHVPTFNKMRHEEERQKNKMLKLAKVLKAMDKTRKKKRAKTIFG